MNAQTALDVGKSAIIGALAGIGSGYLIPKGLDHYEDHWPVLMAIALASPFVSELIATGVTDKNNRGIVMRTNYLCNTTAAIIAAYFSKPQNVHALEAYFCSGIVPLLALCCFEVPTVTNGGKEI